MKFPGSWGFRFQEFGYQGCQIGARYWISSDLVCLSSSWLVVLRRGGFGWVLFVVEL